MRAFSSGEWARFICDRCGLEGRYADSVKERETLLRVHPRCLDEPIRYKKPKAEAQGLRDPRPDHYEPADADAVVGAWFADSAFVRADSSFYTADGGVV